MGAVFFCNFILHIPRRMKNYIVSWLLLLSGECLAQSALDSLKTSLALQGAKLNESEQASMAANIGWIYFSEEKLPDSALKYYTIARSILSSQPDGPLKANTFTGIAAAYHQKGRFDSSILLGRRALTMLHDWGDSTNALFVSINLAAAYKNIGLYLESLSASFDVLALAPEKQSILIGSTHNNIGSIYTRTRNFQQGLEHYRLAAANPELREIPLELSRVYNNIGELFIQTRQYDSAIQNFNTAIALKRLTHDSRGLVRSLGNLAQVSILLNRLHDAQQTLDEAEAIQSTGDDPVGRIELMHHRADWFIQRGEPLAAQRLLESSYNLIRLSGTPEHLRSNLERQLKIDETLGNSPAAVVHLKELLVIRDSLLNIEKARSLQALQLKYETERREHEIVELKQQDQITQSKLQKNQVINWALSIGFLLVAVVTLLLYVNWRNARRSESKIASLLFETRHRIKNHLQTLVSIFSLQAHQYKDTDLALEASRSESRVHAMSLLHERLSEANPDELIETREYLNNLINTLADIYGDRIPNLQLSLDLTSLRVPADTAMTLGLIVHELFCNAVKYAFLNHPSPKLGIESTIVESSTFMLIVRDNGTGIRENTIAKDHGLGLIATLSRQLNGNFEAFMEKGTTFIIKFPLHAAWKKLSS